MDIQENIVDELNKNGYYVVENYFSSDECAKLVKHIDYMMKKHKDKIQRDYKEGMGGDYRIFGLENTHYLIRKSFYNFEYMSSLKKYCGMNVFPCTVLGGIVKAISGKTINSGSSWHRDPPSKLPYKRIKAIIYLTDVTEKNGPFTFIPNTRYTDLNDNNTMLRISEEFVSNLDQDPVEFHAKAGTMIIADITNIHRGKPIVEGNRYSMTYYFKNDQRGSESFKRMLRRKNYIIPKK